jgi:RIP metalloprotease RseP
MDPTTILYFFYALIGISIIIFIHELGHFLAAKRVGVRVEAFSVGFDPTVFGRKLRLVAFTRGETEYIIGLVPFGGYVKMAGETSMDAAAANRKPEPDWLVSKTPGQRAQVFAAGAVFNIISALFFFMIAFSIGTKFTAPSVGSVSPGMPAWMAGVQPGDAVAEVDGKEIRDFNQLIVSVAFGDQSKPRAFRMHRNGELTDTLSIRPEWEPDRGFYTTGIAPNTDSLLTKILPDSAAEAAGIQKGDRLVGASLGGTKFILTERLGDEVSDQIQAAVDQEGANAVAAPSSRQLYAAVRGFYQNSASSPIQLLVARGDGLHWTDINVTKKTEPGTARMLGVHFLPEQVVESVQPGSDADAILDSGDRIVSINGKPFLSGHWFGVAATHPNATEFLLSIENAKGEVRAETVNRARLLGWDLSGQIFWKSLEVRIGNLEALPSLTEAGFRQNDVIVEVDGSAIRTHKDFETALAGFFGSDAPTLSFRILRDSHQQGDAVEILRQIMSKTKIPLNRSPRVLVVGPDTAAARLGIESGSHILQIAETKTENWDELTAAVLGSSPATEVAVRWRTPGGEEKSATGHLTPNAYGELGLVPEQKRILVREDPVTSLFLGFERSIVVAKWVFLTLKGLAKREVAAKNLAGPVGVVHLIVRVSEWGLGTLIYWLALISINLGILNLMPFPILDGGHLLFLLIEKVKGSPVSLRIQEIATTVAFFLIISLAVFVTYNDIVRLFM